MIYPKQVIVSLLLVCWSGFLMSGTPVTDIVFYTSYLEFKVVKKAEEKGILDDEISEFLLDEKVALDLKAAVINALSWEILGKDNAGIFKEHLAKKYGKPSFRELNIQSLKPAELMCLAYIIAMDDYFNVENALVYITEARKKTRDNYTINLVFLIIKSQLEYTRNKCNIWKDFSEFKNRRNYWDPLLSEEQQKIDEYFSQFEKYCSTGKG